MYLRRSAAYDCHYTASPYYFVWTVIADRVRTAESILDVGCGPGQLAQLLMEQRLRDYVGVDISEVAIDMARERVPGAKFLVEDVCTGTTVATSKVDVVIATEALEHLDDDLGLLGQIAAGTRVVATVPNFDWPSHVRHFPDEKAVLDRYAPLFGEVDVVAIRKNEAGRIFYLIDGIIATRDLPARGQHASRGEG